jgi:hypothetical protein
MQRQEQMRGSFASLKDDDVKQTTATATATAMAMAMAMAKCLQHMATVQKQSAHEFAGFMRCMWC